MSRQEVTRQSLDTICDVCRLAKMLIVEVEVDASKGINMRVVKTLKCGCGEETLADDPG